MIAAGQNLKRLLKKRGWGRRPFPAEAGGVVAPPDWEEDEILRKDTPKRKRAWVSVASPVSLGTTRTWLDAQISTFSHPLFIHVHSHIFYYVFFIVFLSALLHSSFPNELCKEFFNRLFILCEVVLPFCPVRLALPLHYRIHCEAIKPRY